MEANEKQLEHLESADLDVRAHLEGSSCPETPVNCDGRELGGEPAAVILQGRCDPSCQWLPQLIQGVGVGKPVPASSRNSVFIKAVTPSLAALPT